MPFVVDSLFNRKHTCGCGAVFYDASGTSKRCPACRTSEEAREKRLQRMRQYRKRKKGEKQSDVRG